MKTPFFGVHNVSRSRNLAYNRLINLEPSIVETKDGKEVGAFFNSPGLDLLATVGDGPILGSFTASNGLLYVVSGAYLYQVNSAWQSTKIGNVGGVSTPCKFIDNGTQILVTNGGGGWCYNYTTNVLTDPISSLGITVAICAYQDGFGLVNDKGTNKWYQSNLNDFSTWSALNFSSADSTPDQIVSMFDLHREVWLFKQNVTEIWLNAGNPGFSFQRLQGVQMPEGIAAPYSISRLGDSIVWLGADEQGQGVVYINDGYRARRISTHAIEFAIQGYSTISDAIAYSYQNEGHFYYVITFPTGGETYVYDYTASSQVGFSVWHQRASFSNGAFSRHIGNCHAFFNGKHVIGDYQNGNLYAFNSDTYTDNGATRKWLRSWPAFPKIEEGLFRYNSLEIFCQTGIGIPDGTNPQMVLRWSDDGGHTWSNELFASGNTTGSTSSRIMFRRLGQDKRSDPDQRVFELSGTDPVPQALIGAYLDVEPT